MAIPVGSKAPDFTLKSPTPDGLVDVTLSSFEGKQNVVLLFFPAAFTGVCTKEFCDISGGRHTLPNAVTFGVSTDTAFAQAAWAKQESITTPFLSDYESKVTKAYDAQFPSLAGLGPCAARAAIVIDKQGIVRYSEQTPTLLDMPDFKAIEAALAAL